MKFIVKDPQHLSERMRHDIYINVANKNFKEGIHPKDNCTEFS
jgi:hypothetical protein